MPATQCLTVAVSVTHSNVRIYHFPGFELTHMRSMRALGTNSGYENVLNAMLPKRPHQHGYIYRESDRAFLCALVAIPGIVNIIFSSDTFMIEYSPDIPLGELADFQQTLDTQVIETACTQLGLVPSDAVVSYEPYIR